MTTAIDRLARMPKGREYNQYVCLTCDGEPLFDLDEFGMHLLDAHGITPGTTGTCHMALFSDSFDFYMTAYHWNILGVEVEQFLQTVKPPESQVYNRGIA